MQGILYYCALARNSRSPFCRPICRQPQASRGTKRLVGVGTVVLALRGSSPGSSGREEARSPQIELGGQKGIALSADTAWLMLDWLGEPKSVFHVVVITYRFHVRYIMVEAQ